MASSKLKDRLREAKRVAAARKEEREGVSEYKLTSEIDGKKQNFTFRGDHRTVAIMRGLLDAAKDGIAARRALEDLKKQISEGDNSPRLPWDAFEECEYAWSASLGLHKPLDGSTMYQNSHYTVAKYPIIEVPGLGRIVHLSLRRNDRRAIHDWRDLQRIKNDICGPEAEGIELYPAESRLVDGANQYHMFVMLDTRWPLGFTERLVTESLSGGVSQRPWRDDEKPADLRVISEEEHVEAARKLKKALGDPLTNGAQVTG